MTDKISSEDFIKAFGNGAKDNREITQISDNDLISRSALKKAIEGIVVGGAERLKDYYENGSKSDENSWIGGIYNAWELVVNAPTELFPLTIKINDNVTDEDIELLKRLMRVHCGSDVFIEKMVCRE